MNFERTTIYLLAMIVPVSLYIMDYWLWIDTGTGNANYMFFQCLAFTTFVGCILLEYIFALVMRDKALRLTELQLQGLKNGSNFDVDVKKKQ